MHRRSLSLASALWVAAILLSASLARPGAAMTEDLLSPDAPVPGPSYVASEPQSKLLERSAAGGQVQFPGPKKDNDKNAPKNLTGQVVDKEGKGLADAVVYLKDKRTLEVKTHISDERGGYRFSGLDPNTDYEVRAESNGLTSPKRTVSSFDNRKDIYLVLEIGSTQ